MIKKSNAITKIKQKDCKVMLIYVENLESI